MEYNNVYVTNPDRIVLRVFTASGTYTATPGTFAIIVTCQGGGGGSGGCAATGASQNAVSGNAGCGGCGQQTFDFTQAFDGATITVGAGGAGGPAGQNTGQNGGTSSFLTLSASGGLSSFGSPASSSSLRRTPSGVGFSLGGAALPAYAGAPRGVAVFTQVLPVYGKRSIGPLGYGNGGLGVLNFANTVATAGRAGQAGIVTILEFVGDQ